MGRWRPPQPEPAPYITAEGFRSLQAELSEARTRRREVVAALAAAAAEGDRSENAEYIYRKRELAGIDRRISYLQRRLPRLKVVESIGSSERVVFGAWVRLACADKGTVAYRIVGADDIGAARNYISIDSPLARALIGKRVGDEVSVQLPSGEASYAIAAISDEA
jgi:transcription elongation factor GreB